MHDELSRLPFRRAFLVMEANLVWRLRDTVKESVQVRIVRVMQDDDFGIQMQHARPVIKDRCVIDALCE